MQRGHQLCKATTLFAEKCMCGYVDILQTNVEARHAVVADLGQ